MFKGCILLLLSVLFSDAQTTSVPVILNASESANAGDVFFVQGSDFGTFPIVQYSFNDGNWTSIATLNAGHGYVSAQLPKTESRLPDLLTVRVSADSTTWSAPIYINQARGISLDSDQIAADAAFRIFGRNLYFNRMPSVRFVDQANGASSDALVETLTSTPYLLTVTAPSNVMAGHTYSIYVSNGYNGNDPSGGETLVGQTLTGRNNGTDYWNLGVAWAPDLTAYTNIFNARTDTRLALHATGNGVSDDTAALVGAVAAAGSSGGGVVFLPQGVYKLVFPNGCALTLPKNVVLMGAGQTATIVNYGYGSAPVYTDGGYAVCFTSQTGISDLTMNNVNESGHWPQAAASVGSQKVFLQRVTWNLSNSQWITLQNAHYVTIQNSTITQGLNTSNWLGPLALQGCSQCEIKNNTIKFAMCGMLFDGSHDLVFENNTVTRDVSVAFPQNTVTHSIAANFVTDFTVLNNDFSSVGGALATNNDGEVIATEAGGPTRFDEFRGTTTASDLNSITDANQNFLQSGNSVPSLRTVVAKVAIISGSGMGQVRSVSAVSSDGKTLQIDRSWDVPVASGSNYATFDWSASNWIVANNNMAGNYKGIEIFDASASDVLIQSNILTDTDGIMVSPSQNPPGLFNVIRRLSILNNFITDTAGIRPAFIGIVPREDSQATSFGTAVLGATVRGNSVTGYVPNVFVNKLSWDDYKVVSEGYLNYWFWQSASGYSAANAPPPILGTIFQSNAAHNSKAAFVLNTGASETVVQDFFPQNVGQTISDEFINGSVAASQGTILQGAVSFLSVFIGNPKSTSAIRPHPVHPQK